MKPCLNLFSFSCVFLLALLAFLDEPMKPRPDNEDERLMRRVTQLEQRVEQLERIIFSTAQLTRDRAEARLQATKNALRDSESLFSKGFITELQLQRDQFNYRQAQEALKLATGEQRQEEIIEKMEILAAEQYFKEAKQQFEYAEKLASRGYVSKRQLQDAQTELKIAEREYKNMKERLNTSNRLENIKNEK